MTKYSLIIISILFCLSSLNAQVDANFEVDKTEACEPCYIEITNTSSDDAVSFSWSFGNGNTSFEENPQAVSYVNSGTFTITLTVEDASGLTASKSIDIIVHASPIAAFGTTNGAAMGCVPLDVGYTDQSTPGDAPISEWTWDFRDGSFNVSEPNPQHSYSTPGVYDVALTVIDENGCENTVEVEDYVKASEPPVVDFSADNTQACNPPLTVNFSGDATGTGSLSYSWDFGDGTTGAGNSPSHTYGNYESYDVSLTVTDEYGCPGTKIKEGYINIMDNVADFNMRQSTDTILSGDSACVGTVHFLGNATSNYTKYYPQYGQSNTAVYGQNATFDYQEPGTYNVMQVTGYNSNCADTLIKQIVIIEIEAFFECEPYESCSIPATVSFNNLTPDVTSCHWNFGNDSTSEAVSPSHTYYEEGEYVITLVAEGLAGCTDIFDTIIKIDPTDADYWILGKTEGCVPLHVVYSDSSESIDSIVDWEWHFGDGTTSDIQHPTHDYNNPGEYYTYLIVTTEQGCVDTSAQFMVQAGTPPHPDFTFSPNEICIGDTVHFTDLTPPEDSVDTWYYETDGMQISHCSSSGGDVSWAYQSGTGSFDINYVTSYNGCYSEKTVEDAVTVKGPFAKFAYNYQCASPYNYYFEGYFEEVDSWLWEFGDGNVDSIAINPEHTYTETGDYTVRLTAYNETSGCEPYIYELLVKVREIKASFIINDTPEDTIVVCEDETVSFNGSESSDVHVTCHDGYLFDFDDKTPGQSENATHYHEYEHSGIYETKLIVSDVNGCRDTARKVVKIFALEAGYEPSIYGGCPPLEVVFNDTSLADTAITSYTWSYSYNSQEDTVFSPTHIFDEEGTYRITLTIEDAIGCTSSVTDSIVVANPSASFIAYPYRVCLGEDISFVRSYSDADSIQWNINGEIITDPAIPLNHTFDEAGDYTVKLTVFEAGCMDEVERNDYISVEEAEAKYSLTDTVVNCYPENIVFNHLNADSNEYVSYEWEFGDDGNSSLLPDSVQYNYTRPGGYWTSLEVVSDIGCRDKDSIFVLISGPYADLYISADSICKGEEVFFEMRNPNNVVSAFWEFGDGIVDSITTTSHVYTDIVGMINPTLWITGADGCEPALQGEIYIHEVIADFNRNGIADTDTSGCAPFDMEFANVSIDSSGTIVGYSYYINGILETSSQDFTKTFEDEGVFDINLAIESSIGCVDTITKSVVIFNPPNLMLNIDNPIVCEGDSALIYATVDENQIVSHQWTPTDNLPDTNSLSNVIYPDEDIVYELFVEDVNGCTANSQVELEVIHEPNPIYHDTTVIIGETVDVVSNPEDGFTYEWTPPTGLSCTNCPEPIVNTLESQYYTVTIRDDEGCFVITRTVYIGIREEYSLDMPTAFTPDGDNVNDVVYVKGWGIKELLEFKVFNRWGQLVFESNDLSIGWDGTYNGKLQNIDTYVYQVRIVGYDDEIREMKGTLNLIR